MTFIEIDGLRRSYRVADKRPGLRGALAHLVSPRFHEHVALHGLALRIDRGERVACLGPNGAGKSTLIKMLAGILQPTAGRLRVDGRTPFDHRLAHAMGLGVVFGQRTQLWWDLPVIESWRLLGAIYRVPSGTLRRNIEDGVESLGLRELVDRPTRQLSLGQRMRCELVAAVLHDPRLMLLDEPTIGLDLAVKQRLYAFVRRRQQAGATLLLTSHDLADVRGTCDRIVMLDRGRLVFDGSERDAVARYGGMRTIRFRVEAERADAEALRSGLEGLPIAHVSTTGDEVTLRFDDRSAGVAAITSRVLERFRVRDLTVEGPDIETIVRRLYEGELAEGVAP